MAMAAIYTTGTTIQHRTTIAHIANDSDSLSSLTLSQGMWFTTTMTQLDALANPNRRNVNYKLPASFPPFWCN